MRRRYLQTAGRYFDQAKYRQASILYRRAIRWDGKFAEAYYGLALSELKQNRLTEAVRPLRISVELLPPGPKSLDAKTKLADLLLLYLETFPNDKSVREELDRLVADLAGNPSTQYDGNRLQARVAMMEAVAAAKRGMTDRVRQFLAVSIDRFRAADALKPFQQDILVPLARNLISQNQLKEAEDVYLSLLHHDKTLVSIYGELYNLYVRQSRMKDAEEILKQGLSHNPAELLFLSNLATHYHSQHRPQEALQMIERLQTAGKGTRHMRQAVGAFYLKLGNSEEAIRQFEAGITDEPGEKNYYRRRIAETLISVRKAEEAHRYIDAILKDDPKDAEARLLNGWYFYERGDLTGAITELRAAVNADLGNPVARYRLASVLMAQGQNALALAELQKAVQLDPGYIEARIKLTQAQILLDQYEGAIKTTQNIFEDLDPRNPHARLLRAIALRKLGRLDEARSEVQFVLKLQPDWPEALLQMGEIYAAENRSREAEQSFRRAYDKSPSDIRPLLRISELNLDSGVTSGRALQILSEEGKKHPERLDLRRATGDMALRSGSYDRAIQEYQAILAKLDPKSRLAGEIQASLGEAFRAKGRYDLALDALTKARGVLADDPIILSNLAVTLLHLGRHTEAKQLYESTIRLQTNNPITLNNLAYLLMEGDGDLDLALTYAQRARQSRPNQPEFSDTVASIYLKKDLVENALEIFEDLVRKNPNNPEFRIHLGEALIKKGNLTRAKKELQTALANNPSERNSLKIKSLLAQ